MAKIQRTQFSIDNIRAYSKVLIILDQLDVEYKENDIDYKVDVYYVVDWECYRLKVTIYEETG